MKKNPSMSLLLVVVSGSLLLSAGAMTSRSTTDGYQFVIQPPALEFTSESGAYLGIRGMVTELFDRVTVAGYESSGDEGGPALPVSHFEIALEDGVVEVQIDEVVTRSIALKNRLYPVQPMRCSCGEHVNPPFTVDDRMYEAAQRATPEPYVSVSEISQYRGQKTATVSIRPVVYDGATRSLTTVEKIVFTLKMKKPSVVRSLQSPAFDQLMRASMVNLEGVPSEPFHGKEKYLIIALPEFKDNADLKRFIDFKSTKYAVKLVSTADIGGTTKDSYRDFIRKEMPTFCLLVGSSPKMPTHSVSWSTYTAKSFEYYVATQIASGTKRPKPDIALGLFYVASAAEITAIVNKSIATEEGLRNMPKIFIGQGGNTAAMGSLPAVHCDSVAQNIANRYYPSTSGFEKTVYFSTRNEGNAAKAIEWFNKGIRFYGYNGHGGKTGPVNGFTTSSLTSMKNTIFPFVQISACYTGTFDQSCGAVAAVANKCGPVTYIGSYEPSSMGQHVLSRGYFEAIMTKQITRSGLAFVYAINSDSTFPCITRYMGEVSEGTKAWCAWQYHHFGDPSIETMDPGTPVGALAKSVAVPFSVTVRGRELFFTLPGNGADQHVDIALVNLQGKVVKTMTREKMGVGRQQMLIDGVASGSYILSFTAATGTYTAPIVLSR